MDTNTIIILAAVGIVFVIVLLEYIFKVLYNKGTNALGNARRRHKNVTQGPVIDRLADMYPEIALEHRQRGTATAMNPALMQADVPVMNGASVAAQNDAALRNAAPGPGSVYAAGVSMQAGAVLPAAQKTKKVSGRELRLIAALIAGIGILINLYLIFEEASQAHPGWNRPEPAFATMFARTAMALTILAMIAYAVMIITRKPVYTVFFPVVSTAAAVMLMLGAWWRISDKGILELKKYLSWIGSRSHASSEYTYMTLSICLAAAVFVCYLLYYLSGWRWPLIGAVIISAGLTISMLYVTRRATYLVDRDVYTLGNYFGYALVTLLYALAEPKKAKKK